MVDYALQRANMVESQVRPSDMSDRRIMRAMGEVARERFVPSSLRQLAYMDGPVRVGGGEDGAPARQLLAPRLLGRLIQLMELGPADIVLDIACATGYSSAVLARMVQTVVALEEDPALAERAQAVLGELGVDNSAVVRGNLAAGVASEGPFDAILINGGVTAMPPALLDQLKDQGRLVAVEMQGAVGRATQWRRIGMRFDSRPAFDATAGVLPGFERKPTFVF